VDQPYDDLARWSAECRRSCSLGVR
jgi:hypothetical protein